MKYKTGQKVKVLTVVRSRKMGRWTRRWTNGYVVGPIQMPPQNDSYDIELNKWHWPIFIPRRQGFCWAIEEDIR